MHLLQLPQITIASANIHEAWTRAADTALRADHHAIATAPADRTSDRSSNVVDTLRLIT